MISTKRKPTDWYKRFQSARTPRVVTLETDFAGVKAGSRLLISSPAEIATYISAIPRGESRTIARMRSDLAKRANADAMCPVTTAIFLRIVAEVAIKDMNSGKATSDIAPFWRIIPADSTIAAKLSCGPEGLEYYARLDAA